jgi:hypothetical protein
MSWEVRRNIPFSGGGGGWFLQLHERLPTYLLAEGTVVADSETD